MRILVADISEENRASLRAQLKSIRPEVLVEEVESGYEALLLAEDLNFDLIFLDVRLSLPELWKTTRRLRERNPNSELYLLAAPEQDIEILNALEYGVKGILHRPIDIRELGKCLRVEPN